VTRAILDAAVEEVMAAGYDGFTFDGVAERAGVHRTSVYRRWPDKTALLVDALLASAASDVPQPDTGSLEADLRQLLSSIVISLARPTARAMLRAAAAESESTPEIGRVARAFWAHRIELAAEIVRRAQRRGEAPADLDAERTVVPAAARHGWPDRRRVRRPPGRRHAARHIRSAEVTRRCVPRFPE